MLLFSKWKSILCSERFGDGVTILNCWGEFGGGERGGGSGGGSDGIAGA